MAEFEGPFHDEFEREMKAGLRPRAAPEGFVERTLRKRQLAAADVRAFRYAKSPRRAGPLRVPARTAWLRWGAAACLAMLVSAGLLQHEYERRQAGERARMQVMLALRITGTTLQDVRSKVEGPHARTTGRREP